MAARTTGVLETYRAAVAVCLIPVVGIEGHAHQPGTDILRVRGDCPGTGSLRGLSCQVRVEVRRFTREKVGVEAIVALARFPVAFGVPPQVRGNRPPKEFDVCVL